MVRTGVIKDLKFGSYYFHDSPEGIMMLQLALSQSQYFSSKLGKDVKRGMEKKIKLGWVPYLPGAGYKNARDEKTGLNIIVKDPILFTLVRKMWDLMLTGNYTAGQVLKIANDEWGYRTRKHRKSGGKPLSFSGIYKILTNPFYYGFFEFPKKSGNWVQGSHEPIITKQEFDAVQRMFKKSNKPRPITHEFPFTGCITCGECGCAITGETKMKYIISTKEERFYTYYHCTHRKIDANCSQRKVTTEAKLEEQIEKRILSVTIIPQFFDWAIEALENGKFSDQKTDQAIYETQQKSLAEAQKHLDGLIGMRYRDLISDDDFVKEKAELIHKIAKLKGKAATPAQDQEQLLKLTRETFDFAAHAYTEFKKGDIHKKREIFNYLGQDWTLKDGELTGSLAKYLQPLERDAKRLEKKFSKLEPNKSIGNKRKDAALDRVHSQWLKPWADFLSVAWIADVQCPEFMLSQSTKLLQIVAQK